MRERFCKNEQFTVIYKTVTILLCLYVGGYVCVRARVAPYYVNSLNTFKI